MATATNGTDEPGAVEERHEPTHQAYTDVRLRSANVTAQAAGFAPMRSAERLLRDGCFGRRTSLLYHACHRAASAIRPCQPTGDSWLGGRLAAPLGRTG